MEYNIYCKIDRMRVLGEFLIDNKVISPLGIANEVMTVEIKSN